MESVELIEGYAAYTTAEEIAAADATDAPAITSTVTSSEICITITAGITC
ncbi:LxmA leader domain family RiPP [Streptomyces sp. NPDC002888]